MGSVSTVIIQVVSGIVIFLLGMIAYGYNTRKKMEASKSYMQAAFVDALTGLGNRHKFNKDLEEKIQHVDKKFALCFLDLDDFKHINDNMGHDAGDELLIELARRLEESLSGYGKVYRLGGDEYALIIDNADTKLEVETIVKRVQKYVIKPVDIRGNKVNLEYSLGVSMFPEDTTNSVELINYADTAMYHIKESGKSSYYFHNAALKAQTDSKRKMEKELKTAYVNSQFDIDYQPRLNLKNNEDIWLENFLYWNHPVIGKLKAEYFLRNAEVMGLIIPIDEFMISKAIAKVNELNKNKIKNVHMAINVSLRHFQRNDFVERLCKIVEQQKIEPNTVMFEITDTINMDKIEEYKKSLDRIKKYGIDISINNLEIKYDTLDLLRRLPIDEVKISAEYFTSPIFDIKVVEDIVALCKDLKYKVVITKIEDEASLNQAKKLDVDMVQGNYIHQIIVEKDLIDDIQLLQKDFNKNAKHGK